MVFDARTLAICLLQIGADYLEQRLREGIAA